MVFRGVLIAVMFAGARAGALEPVWSFASPLGLVDSSPAVADLNGDGTPELVLTTTAGMIIAVDGQGRQIWMRGSQIPISLPAAVADLGGGPGLEVLALNQSGRLFCMDGAAGDPIWQYDLPGAVEWGRTAVAVCDLDADGAPEVITADAAGHVLCLSNTGELLWQYEGAHGAASCPAVGPLGAAGEMSILFGGMTAPLVCLDAKGRERWRVAGPGPGGSPVIADLDGDGKNEVVGSRKNAVIAVDGVGRVHWSHETPKEIDSSIVVADADRDGTVEVYAVDLSGLCVALGPDGTRRWAASVRERVRRAPAIADVDGDGELEIVVAGYSGEMYLFSPKGDLKETLAMPSTTNASPTIADFDGDGTPTVIYAGGNGAVLAHRWPGVAAGAAVQSAEYRYGPERRGVYVPALARSNIRITGFSHGDLYAGENTLTVEIENPEGRELRIEAGISRDGESERVRERVSSDAVISWSVPYVIPDHAPVTVRISCRVHDGERLAAHRGVTRHVAPFLKEIADVGALLDAAETAAGRLPKADAAHGAVYAARARIQDYRARAAIAGTLPDEERRKLRDALREELGRFGRMARLLEAAGARHEEGAWPLTLSAANPWAPFGGMDEVLEGRIGDAALHVEAFHGETESAALNVFHWGTAPLSARVEFDALTRGEASVKAHEAITPHEVIFVPTQTLDLSADALPEMNPARVLTLPGESARQVWLTINTRALRPGTWSGAVHVRTLETESRSFTAPLTITVWDAALPEARTLTHCNWGYVSSSMLRDFEEESLADRIAHGNNVFVSSTLPAAKYDENGEILGEIDFSAHDAYVKRYAPHGIILFQNIGGLSGPGGREGAAYARAFVAWTRAWVAHLKELGLDYDRYAMYPVDEPGLTNGLVELYLQHAKLVREADPRVLMYTDPVARITEEELREMAPYVDIWCPNRNGFLLHSGAEKLAIMKGTGAVMWNYECEGNAKHQSPLGYYRGQAWLAWHHELTGIGFWSYCTSSADPWYTPEGTADYLMVYPGAGVVPSKRWEAVRDGMEDYEMLAALRGQRDAGGQSETWTAVAERVLGAQASRIGRFCGIDPEGTTPGKGGLPAMRALADAQFAEIQSVRREIARLLPGKP